MTRIEIAEIIKEILKNDRIASEIAKHKLTEEQIIDALPILIDMNDQNFEKDDFVISFYVTSDGSVKRQDLISGQGKKRRYLKNVLSQSFNPINFEEDKEYIKDPRRGETLSEFTKYLSKEGNLKGLYIYGPMGVGKTFTAKRFAKKLAEQGKNVALISPSSLSSKLKSSFGDSEKQDIIISLLKEVEYLFIDDIGSESITNWFRDEILFSILNSRMEHHKTTFFTSNYDLQALEKKEAKISNSKFYEYDNAKRLLERIKSLAKPVFFDGDNLRHK